jgi:hypothetical protein
MGAVISIYHEMDERQRERLMGYMEAIVAMTKKEKMIIFLFSA